MNFFDWLSTFPTYLQWAFLVAAMLIVFIVVFKRNIEFGKFSMRKPKSSPRIRPVLKPKPKPKKTVGKKK